MSDTNTNAAPAANPAQNPAQTPPVSAATGGKTPPPTAADNAAAAKNGTSPAEEQAKRLYKVKVNGEEKEVSEDELIRGYSKGAGADKAFHEASMTKKQVNALIQRLQEDPFGVLSDPRLGVDVRKAAEEYLFKQLQDEMLPEEQRKLKAAEKELAELKEFKQKQVEAAKQYQMAQLEKHYADQFSNQIIQAVETSGLPKNERTVSRIAYYMSEGLKRGLNLKPEMVIPLVKEDMEAEFKAHFSGMNPDQIAQFLGEDKLKAVREHDLSRLKNPAQPAAKKTTQENRSEQPKKRMKISEHFENLRNNSR